MPYLQGVAKLLKFFPLELLIIARCYCAIIHQQIEAVLGRPILPRMRYDTKEANKICSHFYLKFHLEVRQTEF